jgi:hypothetical protein
VIENKENALNEGANYPNYYCNTEPNAAPDRKIVSPITPSSKVVGSNKNLENWKNKNYSPKLKDNLEFGSRGGDLGKNNNYNTSLTEINNNSKIESIRNSVPSNLINMSKTKLNKVVSFEINKKIVTSPKIKRIYKQNDHGIKIIFNK